MRPFSAADFVVGTVTVSSLGQISWMSDVTLGCYANVTSGLHA